MKQRVSFIFAIKMFVLHLQVTYLSLSLWQIYSSCLLNPKIDLLFIQVQVKLTLSIKYDIKRQPTRKTVLIFVTKFKLSYTCTSTFWKYDIKKILSCYSGVTLWRKRAYISYASWRNGISWNSSRFFSWPWSSGLLPVRLAHRVFIQ